MAQLVKKSACNAGDMGSFPGLGRFPGEGKGHPLQYSGLENSMGCIAHGVTKSQTGLSDFYFHFAEMPGMCSLSSLTKDNTYAPCIGSTVLTTRSPGNSQRVFFFSVNSVIYLTADIPHLS